MKKLYALKKLTAEIMKQDYVQYDMPDLMIMILTGDIFCATQLVTAMKRADNEIRLDIEEYIDIPIGIPVHDTDSLYNVFKRYRRMQKDLMSKKDVEHDGYVNTVALVPESRKFEALIDILEQNDKDTFINYMMERFAVVLKSIMANSRQPQNTCIEMVRMGYIIHETLSTVKNENVYVMLFSRLMGEWSEWL